jgi:UDP-glucose 4-epimerase
MTTKHAEPAEVAQTGLSSRPDGRMLRAAGRGRSIAISGATTFLGRQLVAQLANVDSVSRVVIVDMANPDTANPKTCFYAMDLTQPGVDARLSEVLQAERVDTFVHLAFLESPIHATAWAHEYERSGTLQVLRACHKQRVTKLVVVSSALVYGPHRDNPNFIREDRPLRGIHGSTFVADKVDVETQVEQWRIAHPNSVVTVLRMALLIGSHVDNFATRFLSRALAPTVLGYDPLVQFTHELDALAALELAVERDVAGVFNIASDGVLRLSSAIRLAGHLPIPVPYAVLRRVAGLLWLAKLCEAPAQFVSLLRHLCVVDTERARRELGFRARFTSRDAALELRTEAPAHDAKLLSEAR